MKEINEVRFNGRDPAIAYTDFSAIYLSWVLSGEELETARLHEMSHIWLQHQVRLGILEKDRKINRLLWNIAADLEIAKYIYTKENNYHIKKPRSMLAGGITEDSLKGLKGEYAEDFYNELLKDFKVKSISFDASGNQFDGEGVTVEKEGKSKQDIGDIVKQAKEKAKEEKKKSDKVRSAKQLHETIVGFKPPKPSLASELDRIFGRNKIVRVSSYRRPSRAEGDFLLKGMISKKKAAKFTLYVDRSGSFNPDKTSLATKKLLEVIRKYRGKIEKDIIYFNNVLLHQDPGFGNGGTNYQAVVDDIIRNGSDVSIVITDDDDCVDFEKMTFPKVLVIPVGCVSTSLAHKIGAKEVV
jgi:predicted metal-dependent peptidase